MLLRCAFPVVFAVLVASGCSRKTEVPAGPAGAAAPTRIVVQLDWVAEPEHGGFYQAKARGWFAEAGLDVELVQGGANAYPMQKVATGAAQFAQADSTNVLLAIQEGLPLINIAAVFQRDPTVFLMHADNPVTKWQDLDGRTVMARPEYAFIPFVQKKYGIKFNLTQQSFALQQLVADKNFIQQGYYIAEPYYLMKAGMKPKWLHVWDTGFDAYAVIIANPDWLKTHGAVARKFVAAYVRGWRDYCEGDPAPAHTLMMQVNPNVTADFLAWSRSQIIKENLTRGFAEKGENYGVIQSVRFASQIRQLEELGLLKPGRLTTGAVMTDAYLPK
jgi:NitT/TauT family transport system substrate-binding protein